MRAPLIFAHRGASAEMPENTTRAFLRAIAVGADGIELDARLTTDGIAFVRHDSLGPITSAQLSRLRFEGEPIPLLEEALRAIGGRVVTQIELKERRALPAVIRAVRRARAADAVVLASFDAGTVRDAAEAAPRLPRMLIADPGPGRGNGEVAALACLRRMAAAQAHGLSLSRRTIASEAFAETIRHRGAGLWCWTVDDVRAARRLARWGIGAILTDDPRRLRRALAAARP